MRKKAKKIFLAAQYDRIKQKGNKALLIPFKL